MYNSLEMNEYLVKANRSQLIGVQASEGQRLSPSPVGLKVPCAPK